MLWESDGPVNFVKGLSKTKINKKLTNVLVLCVSIFFNGNGFSKTNTETFSFLIFLICEANLKNKTVLYMQ